MIFWVGVPVFAYGQLRLPAVFTDNAVFQRDKPLPVWGWANPEQEVRVTFGGQEKRVMTCKGGRWNLELDPMPASGEGRELRVYSGEYELKRGNILVGEVWLAGGASNMGWEVRQSRLEDRGIAEEGGLPGVRLLHIPRQSSYHVRDDVPASWVECTVERALEFSAVGYFFARGLNQQLDVPVGIIHSSWGDSSIEVWTSDEGWAAVPELAEEAGSRLMHIPGSYEYRKAANAWLDGLGEYVDEARTQVARHQQLPGMPGQPEVLSARSNGKIGAYQAMIHPIKPYAMRGFLWYQGETNLKQGDGEMYLGRMQALVAGWRAVWQDEEMPFYFVQLAPFGYPGMPGEALSEMQWLQQLAMERIPRSGMVTTLELGDLQDIHPRNKSVVGERLLKLALGGVYGREVSGYSGPLYDRMEVAGGGVVLHFKHVGGGLETVDGEAPTQFAIAGEDGVFKAAQARIQGGGRTVLVTSLEVAAPMQVRFSWGGGAASNLRNKEGLMASPFHSHWPLSGQGAD